MHLESLGNVNSRFSNLLQASCVITSLRRFFAPLREIHAFPFVSQCARAFVVLVGGLLERGYECLRCLKFLFKVFVDLIADILNPLLGHDTLSDQLM